MRPSKARNGDIPRLVSMAKRFHDSVQPEWPWDEAAVSNLLCNAIANGFCTISEAGFIAGIMTGHPLAPDWPVAIEFLWWAEDGTGAAHEREFRQWARANGARAIDWSCRASNTRVAAYLARRGRPADTHFIEVLPCA